jgi:CubicO group peptidase (beta-lactamase class C family)
MKQLFLGVLCALIAVLPGTATARELPAADAGFSSTRLERLDAGIQQAISEQQIAGAVALVQRRGDVVYLKAFGKADNLAGQAMQTDTLFRIASMTKPITSTAVMMLFEEGRFLLDDPVGKYLPEFDREMQVVRKTDDGYTLVPATGPITIRHLLTHTSGISYRFLAQPPLDKYYADADVNDGLGGARQDLAASIATLAGLPLAHQPGAGMTYGLSTDVLGRLVEVLSGKSLDVFFAERIFAPLKMKDSYFGVPPGEQGRISTVYRKNDSGRLEKIPPGVQVDGATVFSVDHAAGSNSHYLSGGAGLISSEQDYARFTQMIFNGGELDGARLLGRKTVELMSRDQLGRLGVSSFGGLGFSLGFSVDGGPAVSGNIGSADVLSWGGFYNTVFWIDPEEQLVAVLMTQHYPYGVGLLQKFRVLVYQALLD